MQKKNILIAFASLCAILVVSIDVHQAYAEAGFQSYVKTDLSAGTNNKCTGITVLPITNYVIQSCDNDSTTTTVTVSQYDGTVISTSTATVSTDSNDVADCWAINQNSGVCQIAIGSAQIGLRRITVTGASSISVTDFTNPQGIFHGYSLQGSNLYGSGTSNFYRVSLSSMLQSGAWSGMNAISGCTSVQYATSISDSKGIVICDTNEIKYFTYNESAGTGAVSLVDTATLIGTYSSLTRGMHIVWDGVYLYVGYENNLMEAIGFDGTDFTTSAIQYNIKASDIKGVNSGYWVILGQDNSIYLLKKLATLTPPNNLVVVQTVPYNYGTDARMNSHNGGDWVISKGNNGNTTLFFVKATTLHNEGDNPIVIPTGTTDPTGGIDCSDSANANLLICRLTDGGNNPVGGVSGIINTGVTNILVSAGVIDGTDTNPQTNGVGYLIVAIAMGVFVGMMWIASRGDMTTIPTFVWFIGTIAIIGSMTAIGWIDPTFLIISVIVVIAFAVAKAKGVFGGGGVLLNEN